MHVRSDGQTLFRGTCIIARVENNHIYIGADSRRTITNYSNGVMTKSISLEICKIQSENGFYYASADVAPKTALDQI